MRNLNKLHDTYRGLEDSLARLVRNYEDAFLILWFDIYDWLEPKDHAWKADLCGILTGNIIGQNIGSRVCMAADPNKPYYQEILTQYRFGETIDELGEYWKELIREEKFFRLRLLLGCLKVYYEEIMPYAQKEMVDFFKHNGRDCPELSPTLRPYKAHRAKIMNSELSDVAKRRKPQRLNTLGRCRIIRLNEPLHRLPSMGIISFRFPQGQLQYTDYGWICQPPRQWVRSKETMRIIEMVLNIFTLQDKKDNDCEDI